MHGKSVGENMDSNDSKAKNKQQSIITAGSEQLAYIYNPSKTSLHPTVFAKKRNLTDVELYVIVNDQELLFSKANAQQSNSASIRIFCKIMESYENNALIDSCQQTVSFIKSENPKTYTIKMKLKPVEMDKFVVQTTITDLTRSKMSIHFTEVDKTNPYSPDNYLVTNMVDMQVYPYKYVRQGMALRVDYLNTKQFEKIKNGTRPLEPQITLSPYASDPAVEDTSRFYNIEESPAAHILRPTHEGLYSSTADTNEVTNLVLPCFGGDYPNINTPQEMIRPLAYLCTTEEYMQLTSTGTKKLAVDEFWFRNSHDLKKAKEQIKVYYTRAMYANLYFSDYREGVLTDRGMLYTVFGPPRILAITSDGEIWTYRDSRNGQMVKFTFRKQKTRLGEPKYVLRRSTEYKPYWDKAVETWRKGNVYRF